MKKMQLMSLVVLMLSLSTVAFAAEPLAYKDAKSVGLAYQHTVLDTNIGQLKGNEYGVQLSYAKKETGFAAHATVSDAHLKGSYEDFGNSLSGGSPSVTVEVSKRIEQLSSDVQCGAYAKYQRYGSLKGGENGTYDYSDGSSTWSDQTKINNLQVMEAGFLLQGDFKQLHPYAGVMLQVIKADLSYHYQEEDWYEWNDRTKITAKSGLGAVAGIAVDFNKNLTATISGTFKEHGSYSAALLYTF